MFCLLTPNRLIRIGLLLGLFISIQSCALDSLFGGGGGGYNLPDNVCDQTDPREIMINASRTTAISGSISIFVTKGECYPTEFGLSKVCVAQRTDVEFSCANYLIRRAITISGNKIIFTDRDIVVPELCLTAFGPASARACIELANGEYELQFKHNFNMDRYKLLVSDSTVEVLPISTSYTHL